MEAEAKVIEIFPVMTEEVETTDQGLLTGIEKDTLLLDPNPEDIILLEVPITGKTITPIEVKANSPDSEDHPISLPGGLDLHPDHSVGTMTGAHCKLLGYFTRECPEKDISVAKAHHKGETFSKCKDSTHVKKKEEVVMAAMCHSAET